MTMLFTRFYVTANVGDKVKITDTFLAHQPTWRGIVKAKADAEITIGWDDDHEDTIFSSANTRDTDKFEIAD